MSSKPYEKKCNNTSYFRRINRRQGIFFFLFLELEPHLTAKRNAEIVLQYSTVYPFRLRGKAMLCVYCCEEYEDPEDFRRHVDDNHEQFTVSTAFAHIGSAKDYLKVDCTNLKCRLCAESFISIEHVAEHLAKEHDRKETRKLCLDYDIGLQPYKLEKDKWLCFHCNKKLPTITKLCRHTTSHYQQYTCDICGRSYMTNDALKYHIKCSHSGNYVCRRCWKDFPTLEEKREHVRTSKSCWAFGCVNCGDRFQSWEQKQKHLVEKHDCPETSYPCPDCDKTFQIRKQFYSHYKMAHTDEGFVCSCCGLKFGAKNQLEDHRLGHTGEKQFKCLVCSKAFTRNKSLSQHMWIHSDVKRFECKPCNKQFNQKVSYRSHMKVHHSHDVE